jgi:hypothetical protein
MVLTVLGTRVRAPSSNVDACCLSTQALLGLGKRSGSCIEQSGMVSRYGRARPVLLFASRAVPCLVGLTWWAS